MTHLDLFSGIGGFALAAKWTGWQTIGFSEIEPYACKVLKRHWPDVPNFGDVRNVPTVRCDLITGGFPCQPFSLAGKRKGQSDDRYLWPAMLDVIARCKPRWVLGENVPGIIGMELDKVLADLEGIGFWTQPIVVPACAVDAGFDGDRVWILAASKSKRLATDLLVSGGEQNKQPMASKERGICEPERLGRHPLVTIPLLNDPPEAWRDAPCEPCLLGTSDGVSRRVDRLRGLGNAIVPQVAAAILSEMAQMENKD